MSPLHGEEHLVQAASGNIVGRWGYTVKTALAASVDEEVSFALSGKVRRGYFAYFTTEFNASDNQSTSNPLEIYKVLDEAVKYGYGSHLKIRGIRDHLARVVASRLVSFNDVLKEQLIRRITSAPLSEFAPAVWKFRMTELPDGSYVEQGGEFVTVGYSLLPELVTKDVIP